MIDLDISEKVLTRRSLLKGASALFLAPGIVRAESLMNLWLPPKPIFLPEDITVKIPESFYTPSAIAESDDGKTFIVTSSGTK